MLVLSPLLILMARSPAVNALNELAGELYNAASFTGKGRRIKGQGTLSVHEQQAQMLGVSRLPPEADLRF
jgi:hypothetical protein